MEDEVRVASKRGVVRLILVLVVFALGCGYGMIAERTERFPYGPSRKILWALRGSKNADPGASGRWRLVRHSQDVSGLTEEQLEEMTRLRSIGYLTGSALPGGSSGVAVHDEGRAQAGLNLVVSGHHPGAELMDMRGNTVHRWRLDFRAAWPDHDLPLDSNSGEYWRRTLLLDDGGVVAIYEGLGLVRLDRDSRLVWARAEGAHHDVDHTPGGGFCVLEREAGMLPRISTKHPVLEDFIVYLDSDGKLIRRISVLEAFERSDYAAILTRMPRKGDIMHTNTLEVLDGTLADRSPAFREGNVLVSILTLDTIAVIDPDAETVVWAMSGLWRLQHQPTVLPDGRMLVFDNKAGERRSRVLELDPLSQEITWDYAGTPDRPFYSETCGSNQRLANGNTLITESDNGRAFEVARDGEIVWEYVNPNRAGVDDEFVATLFEVVRLPDDSGFDWLDGRS